MGKTYLVHSYSSKYYDPEYAHWYYENYTKLGRTKGRKSGSSLNEYGKAAANTVKEKVYKERDEKLEELKGQHKQNRETLSENRSSEIKKQRENYKNDLKSYVATTKNRVQNLWNRLKTLSSSERASQTATIRAEIEQIRSGNDAQKERLKNEYSSTVEGIRSNYKAKGQTLSDEYSESRKQIMEQYKNLYLSELDKMEQDSEFTGRSSSGSSGSSSSSSTPETKKKEKKKHGPGYKMYGMGGR